VTRLAALCAASLALACAAPIHTELRDVESRPAVRKLAVEALEVDPLRNAGVPDDAPPLVTQRIVAAVASETQLKVVPTSESDAVLTGVVRRYSEREGSPSGVRRPAAVWFQLELRDRDGRVIWTGSYEETQPALSEDVASFPRAWERGFRWVTAADLADYGARTLIRELGREIATWS
jgi:hypothetical protein